MNGVSLHNCTARDLVLHSLADKPLGGCAFLLTCSLSLVSLVSRTRSSRSRLLPLYTLASSW
jgi:hypothetical protein